MKYIILSRKLLLVLICFSPYIAKAAVVSEEEKLNLEASELKVQKSLPQYRVNFYHKKVQDEVYKVFLKELEEKEQGKPAAPASN